MIVEQLKFPKYDGNETQYEHIFYTYLDMILATKGYVSKVKKTGFANIDENIIANKSYGSCDSYLLSNNRGDSLFGLLELESTGKLYKGIEQVRNYANGLSKSYKSKDFVTNHQKIYLIVYDGQKMWIVEHDLKTLKERLILGTDKDGVIVTNKERDEFIKLFPLKKIINTQEDEKSLIKAIKNILRASKTLQGNKAFILTVLASIYGNTEKKLFNDSIEYLRTQSTENKETKEIYDKWKAIKIKIDYENSPDIQDKITELYEKVSIKLYLLAQDKKLDLYGYIYEELAEKSSKKEDGEYYTPRTHIRPIVNAVFEKYLKNSWGLKKNKNKSIEVLKKKNVSDIFCGSAGFLYEYLKLLKQKYSLSNNEINDVAYESLSGFDKNDITSAYFNLFLVGDGRSRLTQVTTSINWQNFWKYELIEKSKSKIKKAEKIKDNDKLIKSIENNITTFKCFLNSLVSFEYIKNYFSLDSIYLSCEESSDFLEIYIKEHDLRLDKYFHNLRTQDYMDSDNPVLELFYDTLIKSSSDATPIDFKVFLDNLGNIDYLMTNVPYGDIDDQRIKGKYSGKLESQALKECIDVLRPSSTKINNTTGLTESNDDGGIASIVIPNGLLERDEFELKQYLLSRCDVLSIVKLPFYTFSPYALIQTYYITFRKKATFEFSQYKQKNDIFMYIINNDGKANSDKRFETKLISDKRADILDENNNSLTSIHEYIHDELSINLEEYPEGYLSKLERSWIYGNHESVSSSWNQKRLTEKWNGTEWENLEGIKWRYAKLEIKEYNKQIEISNKKLELIVKEASAENSNFEELEIEGKKEYLENIIKSNYISDIKFAKLHKNGDSVLLYANENSKSSIQNIELKVLIFEEYHKILSKSEKISIENFHSDIISNFRGECNSEVNQIINILNDIDDILIFNSGEEVKFIKNTTQKLYDLNINNYLDNKKSINSEDMYDSLLRLYSLQNKNSFNRKDIKSKLMNAIIEINKSQKENNIPFHTFISSYVERGNRITIEDIYNNYGEYPVYSSTITGNIGYYNSTNQEINENSLLYAIEGNAGSISIPFSKVNKIWLLDVAGVIDIKDDYLKKYSKESISIYLEYMFRNNRHNNSGQPKFLIKKNLDLLIDLNSIEIINNHLNS